MSPEEQRRRVLHALRMASVASVEVVARRAGMSTEAAVATLEDTGQRGWTAVQTGRLEGWRLTTAGRVEGERLLAAELDGRQGRDVVHAAYQRFRQINPVFLELCTRWQVIDVGGVDTPNDHNDQARDAAVLAELEGLHPIVVGVSDDLRVTLERFAGYRDRFEYAIARLRENDVDWFTKPLLDSYHTVWFELHEDLLATLGRDRSSEHTPSARAEGRS